MNCESSCEYIEFAVTDGRQGWSSSLVLGEVLATPHRKNGHICLGPGMILDTTKAMESWHENWCMEYEEPLLVKDTTVVKKLKRNELEEVRWYKVGALIRARIIFFSMEKETKIINWKQASFSPQKNISSLGLLVIGYHISLFWMRMHQLRRNVMTQKKVWVRKESKFWVIFLSTVWNCC